MNYGSVDLCFNSSSQGIHATYGEIHGHVDRSWKIHPDLFMENARLSILGRITRAAIYGKVSMKRHLNMSGGMIHGNFH